MSVFNDLRSGMPYDVRDEKCRQEAHGEFRRCRHICHEINATVPDDVKKIEALEAKLLGGALPEGSFLQPSIYIDCAKCLRIGKNVYSKHGPCFF